MHEELTEEDKNDVMRMQESPQLYAQLADSVAPHIYGAHYAINILICVRPSRDQTWNPPAALWRPHKNDARRRQTAR